MMWLVWHIAFVILPPCPEEDSRDCAWNAQMSGNGIGHSFVDIAGRAYYLDGWAGR